MARYQCVIYNYYRLIRQYQNNKFYCDTNNNFYYRNNSNFKYYCILHKNRYTSMQSNYGTRHAHHSCNTITINITGH